MARLPLANALPLQDAVGRALSGVLVQVRPHNDAFVNTQNFTGSLALTPTPVFVAMTGSTPITDGTNFTAGGTIAGYVEEGYYDLVVGHDGSLPPASQVIRPYPFMDASGTAQLRADSVVTGTILDGTVSAADLQAGLLPATNPDLAYPRLLQRGIELATDLALTFNSASSVSVAAGNIWANTAAGVLVRYFKNSSTTLSGITATATNPRIDRIVFDTADQLVKRLVGAETAATTLDLGTGGVTPGAGQQLIHELLVTTSGVVNTPGSVIRDRRPWCRGGRLILVRPTAFTPAGATNLIDTATLRGRLECTGVPLIMSMIVPTIGTSVAGRGQFWIGIDGTGNTPGFPIIDTQIQADSFGPCMTGGVSTPSAGSHVFAGVQNIITGTWPNGGANTTCTIVEDLRPVGNNGTV